MSESTEPGKTEWQSVAIEGKLGPLVALDFRMLNTCLFFNTVLSTVTWYERDDMDTSDTHPPTHPLFAAVNPVWELESDREIHKDIAKVFSEVYIGHLGQETGTVLQPL